MIYDFILTHGILTDQHRADLKAKRGFTDETIQKYRFFSAGEYLLKLESDLRAGFPETELIKSGVFILNKGQSSMSPLLLQDNVIIPYLRNGKCTMIRPHKLGLKDLAIQPYETTWGKNMIITESEFKAVAADQMGYPAIGIPGVGSFSDTHFPELIKLLNTHEVRCCCIIFDSECKDDPRFANYKSNPLKRYDTEYYAYYMAKMLDKEGKDVRVGTLPESWRINGKIDIDGALAQGHTKEDLAQVIASSKTYRQYLEDLPKEAQSIIRRKLDRKYFRSHIRTEFGCYVATRGSGKKEHDEEIAGFTIRIIAIHDTIDGLVREVVFINKQGEQSRPFSLPSDKMANDAFREFCLNVGSYVWKGRQEDLSTLWEMEFLSTDDTRTIVEPDHIGWFEDEKMWLFGNVAIKNGKELRPDESGIFWVEKKGIRPIPLGITSGKNIISEGVPYISINDKCDIKVIRKNLTDTIGETHADKCLGWVTAVLYMEEIFHLYGCFPFLFLTGKTGSGKSTIAEWLCYFLGIERSGITLSQSTGVGIQRSLGYYSSLPVFLDEYRNTQDIVYKTSFLRNVYNRQSSGKGVKANFGLRMAKVRGTVIVAGEETPNDVALINRSIVIDILKSAKTTDHYDWFTREKVKFSSYMLEKLKSKDVTLFTRVLLESKDYFVTHKRIDERTSINYAIVTAGYAAAFGEDESFAQRITDDLIRVNRENEGGSIIMTFLRDCAAMKFNNQIRETAWAEHDGILYIYFHGLYNLWARDCKARGVDILKSGSLQGYMREEPGYIESRASFRFNGQVRTCISFVREKISPEMAELVEEDAKV